MVFGKDEDKYMGMRCEENPDGSKDCKRFKIKGGEKLSTGTDINVSIDPNTCKARVTGDVNDRDREAVDNEAKNMEDRCKKGF